MSAETTMHIQASDDMEFDRLVVRAGLIEGLDAMFLEKVGGMTVRHRAIVLSRFDCDINTREVNLTFYTQALALLGPELDGRAALTAAEAAIIATEAEASTKH